MIKSLLTFLFAIVCSSCSSHGKDKFSDFPKPQANFQAHIAEVKSYLLATQMSSREPTDVKYNLPFELKAKSGIPYRGKFLLIHGLNDSPYVFSDVSKALVSRGFDVRAILLPGHGNTPEAQLNISYKQWLNAARQQLKLWKADDTPMHLGGFSMGSVISTILALEDKDIDGLLLFSPADKSKMNHLLRWSGIYSRFKPWVFGGMIIEDNPSKYNSIPINGAAQYYKLTKVLKRKWGRKTLDIPVLAISSANDSVVDVTFVTKNFNKRFTSKKKKMLIYSNEKNLVDTDSIDYKGSRYLDLRIINQSHQGVVIAPENPLFGKQGSILVCNGNDWPTFSRCLYSKENHWFGAQHTPSPDNIPVARATFNPDFEGVFAEFDRVFIH